MRSSSTNLPIADGRGYVPQAPNLPQGFTDTFTSRYVDTGELRLHAGIGGNGPPLLLAHGRPQTWYASRLLMPALAEEFEVIAIDQRGIVLPGPGHWIAEQAPEELLAARPSSWLRTASRPRVALRCRWTDERARACPHAVARRGDGWLNSEPLGPDELRGSVVLVNFWTLTCINWLRQEPYVRAWSQAYRDDGLVVLGIHTPEFGFEHDLELVRVAIHVRGIDYPVAADNDYEVWHAFDNHYWPALYFVDRDGIIRDEHFGEGRYEQSERMLQRLLGIDRDPVTVEGAGIEAEADWNHLRTPETYLGYGRGERFASAGAAAYDETAHYELPERLAQSVGARGRVDDRPRERPARRGRRQHRLPLPRPRRPPRPLPGSQPPIPFRVLLDGEAPGAAHGADIDPRGTAFSRRAAFTSSSASTTPCASGHSRSPSSSPEPRRMRSRSASRDSVRDRTFGLRVLLGSARGDAVFLAASE